MTKCFLLCASLFLSVCLLAQRVSNINTSIYQATATKVNDLVHTKLDARFNYEKSQLNGKVWLTLKPHFYPTDSLTLDAKGMEIKEVAVVRGGKNSTLKYNYDGLLLRINLDRIYKNTESYLVYISYIAKPSEFQAKGSAAITDAKGLYFINPLGEDKNKPVQIWTQGETEATSVWVPTIDKPNQKTTDEIYMTVPSKYVTLSNGRLVSQTKNADGTRTDYWKMELPHSPYLFFMGVGDYAVIKDKYKDKEVSYYVEKEYAPVARRIFGKTPEMIALFSKLTGVDYPWVKYSQIVGRDYVSGAMENTTATLHGETAQQDARELTDGNRWEEVISHELFHQWFGDYVTTESWSNLTLNESFATLGSQLWNEFHYGKNAGQEEAYNSVNGYLRSHSEAKDLVRFNYKDKEDMFDAVSYNKGGGILQMLRHYLGDSAFFKGLNLYLTTNKFKSAEAQQLRLAMEEVSGKDLNAFFNQWYYGSGHPQFNITYKYDNQSNQAQVIAEQVQEGRIFKIPVNINVWKGTSPTTYTVWTNNKIDTFSFAVSSKPSLVDFDASKIIVATRKENKTLDEYLFQYQHSDNYANRREAIEAAAKSGAEVGGVQILMEALKDKYAPLRTFAINSLDMNVAQVKNAAEPLLYEIAQKDSYRRAKAAAINKLGQYGFAKYASLFKAALNDSSYSVAGSALEALNKIDTSAAFAEAQRLATQPSKGRLGAAIKTIVSSRDKGAAAKLLADFEAMPLGQPKFQALNGVFQFVSSTSDLTLFKRGIDDILGLVAALPDAVREQATAQIYPAFREIAADKTKNGLTDQASYLESKLPKEDKK